MSFLTWKETKDILEVRSLQTQKWTGEAMDLVNQIDNQSTEFVSTDHSARRDKTTGDCWRQKGDLKYLSITKTES